MEILTSTVSRNLTYYMGLRGVNKSELAKAVGVSATTAGDWCAGRMMPRADKAAAICKYLGINMNDLVAEKPDVPSFEQTMMDNYGVMLRKFGELSEEDKKIVIDLVERLRNGGE